MKYEVIAEARYKYDVEADNEKLAIKKAVELFNKNLGPVGYVANVLE